MSSKIKTRFLKQEFIKWKLIWAIDKNNNKLSMLKVVFINSKYRALDKFYKKFSWFFINGKFRGCDLKLDKTNYVQIYKL